MGTVIIVNSCQGMKWVVDRRHPQRLMAEINARAAQNVAIEIPLCLN
jgi:hypothetical protein